MYRTIDEFPNYMINEHAVILRKNPPAIIDTDGGSVMLLGEDGKQYCRSAAKLCREAFSRIEATDMQGNIKQFKSTKEAAEYLHGLGTITYGGRLVCEAAIHRNIKYSLAQPDVYPLVYGYTWKEVDI